MDGSIQPKMVSAFINDIVNSSNKQVLLNFAFVFNYSNHKIHFPCLPFI